MFEVTGRVPTDPARLPRAIRWDNGRLSGDERLVTRVLDDLRRLEGLPVGPVGGPVTMGAHVRSGISVLTHVLSIMEPGARLDGDIPTRPPLGDGEIG